MRIDIEHLIHSLKTAIACVIALLLTKVIGYGADQWIVITVIVVMCAQIYVGSVIQKSYLRFLGTVAGCLLASITLITFGNSYLATLSCIALASFIFSYLATGQESLSYAGTLGAVTTAIILLGKNPTVIFAIERFLEISLGILIATLISQYILPIHARTHLRRTQAETLKQISNFYEVAIVKYTASTPAIYQELDENIVKTILKQRQLAKESERETLREKFNTEKFMKRLYYEREILRIISFMHNALTHINNVENPLTKLPELQNFNMVVQQALTTFIRVIKTNGATKEHIHLPNFNVLQKAVLSKTTSPAQEQMVYINGFLFSSEILADTLAKLAKLYGMTAYPALS